MPTTPERVAALCWIEPAQVEALAGLLHEAGPAVSYACWAGIVPAHQRHQTDRAIATLMALTGNFDAPGGNVEMPAPAKRRQRVRTCFPPRALHRARAFAARPGQALLIGSGRAVGRDPGERLYPIRAPVGFGRDFLQPCGC